MDAYRVERKVLQRRDDERVVGRATQDAIDVASQARVVAHESREAYGDARPPWRDAACRQGHAARARSKLQRAQSSHLNKFPAWESRRTQRRMEMLETPSWTYTHCAGARHSASRSSSSSFRVRPSTSRSHLAPVRGFARAPHPPPPFAADLTVISVISVKLRQNDEKGVDSW